MADRTSPSAILADVKTSESSVVAGTAPRSCAAAATAAADDPGVEEEPEEEEDDLFSIFSAHSAEIAATSTAKSRTSSRRESSEGSSMSSSMSPAGSSKGIVQGNGGDDVVPGSARTPAGDSGVATGAPPDT